MNEDLSYNDLEIKIVNDGKGKDQSFEASIDINRNGINCVVNINATGYGRSEAEARLNLNWAIRGIIKETNLIK